MDSQIEYYGVLFHMDEMIRAYSLDKDRFPPSLYLHKKEYSLFIDGKRNKDEKEYLYYYKGIPVIEFQEMERVSSWRSFWSRLMFWR